jgi:hypothetical protein
VADPPNDVVEAWSIVAADAAAMFKTEVAAASDTFIIRGDRDRRKGRRPESIARDESEPALSIDIECSLAQDEYENEADIVDAQNVIGTTSELAPPPKTRVDFQMGSSCHVAATGDDIPPLVQWVQCDECKKWRRVSQAVFDQAAGDRVWTCPDNYADDPLRGSCDASEEAFEENGAIEAAVEVISSCDDGEEDDRWTTTARPRPAAPASSLQGATTRASHRQGLKRARRDY